MESQTSITKRSFLQAILILFILLIFSGVLTRVIPTGEYQSVIESGKRVIVAGSYTELSGEVLPIYKWFSAPIDVLFGNDGALIISIILFLLIVGGSVHVLNESHVISSLISKIVSRFQKNKFMLLRIVSLVFMSLGAFVGIFEEIIPLIPITISLSLALGFDVFTGLGISLLATGFGFSAAVSNPFTIGVAQQVAGLPLFTGSGYRFLFFILTYLLISELIIRHAKKVEGIESAYKSSLKEAETGSVKWFLSVMLLIMLVIILIPFVEVFASYNLVIIGILFFIAGIGSGWFSFGSKTFSIFFKGVVTILPGIVLILLATGVKHIIETGKIMDTILYIMSKGIAGSSSIVALLVVYLFVFIMNFFIGSGSAKAFIIIPIIAPLMDLLGISRQLSILAFQFGDGFSNILFPTNAVLLIGLGISQVSYVNWLKYVFKFQVLVGLLSVLFLYVGLMIGY